VVADNVSFSDIRDDFAVEPDNASSPIVYFSASATAEGASHRSVVNRVLIVNRSSRSDTHARRPEARVDSNAMISATTVKMHTLSICRKLDVSGSRRAVVAAMERGILTG